MNICASFQSGGSEQRTKSSLPISAAHENIPHNKRKLCETKGKVAQKLNKEGR